MRSELEHLACIRAQEQMESGAWRRPDSEVEVVVVKSRADGAKTCGRCERSVTARNNTGLCHDCWGRLSPKRRREWVAAYEAAREAP